MTEDFTIRSYRHMYKVSFVSDFAKVLQVELRPGDRLIVDQNVWNLFPELAACVGDYSRIMIDTGEDAKSYEALIPLLQKLINERFTKSNRLIAIGGGIVQDITAFTASILFRGVDWLFFPTNLLSQCDSCIGSKTSINFGSYKNQLGGFYPPKAIFIDLAFLNTLPTRELYSGFGEMLHYFLVSGDSEFQWVSERIDKALQDREVLQEMILRSLRIKKTMIERDEFDVGPRNVFNYGHSFGHALESATGYAVPHGIAVSYGMDMANIISARMGFISMSLRNRIRTVLEKILIKAPLEYINSASFISALAHDKKNEGMEIKVILTKGVGKMFKTTLVLNEEITKVVDRFFVDELYVKDL